MYFILRFVLLLKLCSLFSLSFGVNICSWNLKDFGSSKSSSELQVIVETVKAYDIIAIQEVVSGDGGAQAIAKLHYKLNQTGTRWDYSISDPTSSSAYKSERYAFFWKTGKVTKVGNSWLEKKYHLEIDREPFFTTFKADDKEFTVVNFHAITKNMQPETEIKYFKYLPSEYPDLNL